MKKTEGFQRKSRFECTLPLNPPNLEVNYGERVPPAQTGVQKGSIPGLFGAQNNLS